MTEEREPPYKDAAEALVKLAIWIRQTSDRLSAQESIIKQRLGVTDDEWARALVEAQAALPPGPEGLDGFPFLVEFLQQLLERR